MKMVCHVRNELTKDTALIEGAVPVHTVFYSNPISITVAKKDIK